MVVAAARTSFTLTGVIFLQAPDRAVSPATSVGYQCYLPQDAPVCGLLLIVPCSTKTEHTRRPQTQEILMLGPTSAHFVSCALSSSSSSSCTSVFQ